MLLLVNDIDPGKRELLRAEGFTLHGDTVGGDFLQQSFDVGFDVIVQNPPFWKRMDARHILWAYECLRRGGRLVSVAGANLRWRGDSEYEQVRRLVAERGGTIEDLPEGSFRESGTDVSAVVVVVDK